MLLKNTAMKILLPPFPVPHSLFPILGLTIFEFLTVNFDLNWNWGR